MSWLHLSGFLLPNIGTTSSDPPPSSSISKLHAWLPVSSVTWDFSSWARDERASPAEIHSMYPLSSRSICCCRLSFRKTRRFSTRSLSLANSWRKRRRVRSGCFRNFRGVCASVCVCVDSSPWRAVHLNKRNQVFWEKIREYYRSGHFCQLPTFPTNYTQLEKNPQNHEPCHANHCWL